MARKLQEELNELKEKLGVDKFWSWSRYNKYKTSPYEYFLKYLKRANPDRKDSIYTYTGSLAHDILEKFYENEITYGEMAEIFQEKWLIYDTLDLKFNRSDEEMNEKIKLRYKKDLDCFFRDHKILENNVLLEEFIQINVDSHYFIGYIDLLRKDDKGNIIIQDWKTSSIYLKDKAVKEAGQLLLYAIGVSQTTNTPMDKIKICWNFLKYCNITIQQKNGDKKVRQIQRSKLGESLKANCKMWLKEMGYTKDEILEHTERLIMTNNLNVLPQDIREKYEMDDCHVFVDITDELIGGLKADISQTLNEIANKEKEYETSKDDKLFWDNEEKLKTDEYYFLNLCEYSPKLHKPLKEYLDKKDAMEQEKNNIFIPEQSSIKNKTGDDWNWLNEL